MTTNSALAAIESHGYTHPGFPTNNFPAPPFPIQNYPITNYPMPAPVYAAPYGYPFTMPGAAHMQQNFPPAFLMQNYPMLNNPMPAPMPMYAPPYGNYPFAMPAPQDPGANYGRKRQYSVSDPITQPVDEVNVETPDIDTNVGAGEWDIDPDTLEP